MLRKKDKHFSNRVITYLLKWVIIIILPIFTGIIVLNCPNLKKYWLCGIAIYIFILIPVFFYDLLVYSIISTDRSEEEIQIAIRNVCKKTILFWSIEFLFIAMYKDARTHIFIFGILALILIFYDLFNAFLYSGKSLKIYLCIEFAISLLLSAYLVFLIQNEIFREIILAIVAALLGGMLTLVGVAWTIKEAEDKRMIEEYNKAKPLFAIINAKSVHALNADNNHICFTPKDVTLPCSYSFRCNLMNTDKCVFFINKIESENEFYFPETSLLVTKDMAFQVRLMHTSKEHIPPHQRFAYTQQTSITKNIFTILSQLMVTMKKLKKLFETNYRELFG